jgi:hypothetical protein
MKDQETLYVECDCGHNDHTMKFTFTEGDNYDVGSVYMAVQMGHGHIWYERIWLAIKYIFGYQSRFGHWDCVSLDYIRLRRIREFVDAALKEMEKDSRAKAYSDENYEKPFCPTPIRDTFGG